MRDCVSEVCFSDLIDEPRRLRRAVIPRRAQPRTERVVVALNHGRTPSHCGARPCAWHARMSFAAATCRSAKHRRHAARAAAKRRDKGRPARGSAAPFYLAFHAFDVASVVAPTPQITQGSASVLSGVGGSRRSRTNSRGSGDGASLPFAVRATAVIANNGLVAGTPSCSISSLLFLPWVGYHGAVAVSAVDRAMWSHGRAQWARQR